MSGIHVLSDILKGGNKLEKTATLKGQDVSDSPKNAATTFATMLSGSMNQNVDPKSKASQDSEEKQSADDPVQSDQNPNGLGSTPGYGSFMMPNLFQAILQRNIPAGKDANSGNDVSQETDGFIVASTSLTNGTVVSNNNLELAMLNLVSLTSGEVSTQSGMTTPKPQGDNPGNPELDKYRQVIGNLLVELSGEITDPSLKGTTLGSESSGTKGFSQDMAKIVQGWMTATDEGVKSSNSSSSQVVTRLEALLKEIGESTTPSAKVNPVGSESANSSSPEMVTRLEALLKEIGESTTPSAKVNPVGSESANLSSPEMVTRLEALLKEIGESTTPSAKVNPVGSESSVPKGTRQDVVKTVQDWMTATDEGVKSANSSSPEMVTRLEALLKEIGESTTPSAKVNPVGSESSVPEGTRQDVVKTVQDRMTATDEGVKSANSLSPEVVTRLEALLKEIGESITPSAKVNPVGSESSVPKVTRQDLVKIVQDWMMATDEGSKEGQASSAQKGVQLLSDGLSTGSGNPVLNAKVATLMAALNPLLRQGDEASKVPQVATEIIEAEGGKLALKANESSESNMKSLDKPDLRLVATPVKDTASVTNDQQKLDGIAPKETLKIVQGTFREVAQKGDGMLSAEISSSKDVQNQNSNPGIGIVSNLIASNVADGKTVAIPVFEQISNAFREQVANRSRDLKQLDIQLHPADLGKIQISLRWENGQVHLQVQASEAATGHLLQNQLSDLRQTLTSQGVNCGMLQMGQGGDRQHNPQGDESQRTFKQSSDLSEEENLIPVGPTRSLGKDEINRINVTA